MANLLLIYVNGFQKWIYNFKIKTLLFELKFLPKSKNIKMIKIFPTNGNNNDINIDMDNHSDKDNNSNNIKVY